MYGDRCRHGYWIHSFEPEGGLFAGLEVIESHANVTTYKRTYEEEHDCMGDGATSKCARNGNGLTQKDLDELATIRTYATGATRDTDAGKLKYEGFFSPSVLRRRAEYMNKHRLQTDGELRRPDNWQLGIAKDDYADSLVRHSVEFWLRHRDEDVTPDKPSDPQDMEEVICAIMFNCEGYLHEILKAKKEKRGEVRYDLTNDAYEAEWSKP